MPPTTQAPGACLSEGQQPRCCSSQVCNKLGFGRCRGRSECLLWAGQSAEVQVLCLVWASDLRSCEGPLDDTRSEMVQNLDLRCLCPAHQATD